VDDEAHGSKSFTDYHPFDLAGDGKAVEGKDYHIDRLTEFWKITGEQDWELCVNNFKGVESSHYRPGPYAPVEADVSKYVDWYIARMREGVNQVYQDEQTPY
jgi:hypothetical protein